MELTLARPQRIQQRNKIKKSEFLNSLNMKILLSNLRLNVLLIYCGTRNSHVSKIVYCKTASTG